MPDKDDRSSPEREQLVTEFAADPDPSGDDALLTADDHFLSDAAYEEDDQAGIGQALHRARVGAGLTVDDISSATRVRAPIVHAIEQDDFSCCGGDVYARGHIRTLARAVGLDPAPLLVQFEEKHGGKIAPTPATPLFEAERIRPERRAPNWTAAMVAAIVAVVGFVGFTFVHGNESGNSDKTQTAKGANPAATTSAKAPAPTPTTAMPVSPAPTDSAIAAAPGNKVTVVVDATGGRSWMSAKDHNGRVLFDGLIQQGQRKTFQDDQKIDLILGDAGSLQLYVNGKKINNDFTPGQVERLTYTKGDPEVG